MPPVSLEDAIADPSKVDNLSPEEHAALMQELAALEAGGTPGPAKEPAKEPAADPAPEEEKEPAKEPEKQAAAGVLAPDGKSVIPYSELANARKQARDAQEALSEMAGTVNDLTARLKALEQGGSEELGATNEVADIKAEIEALAEEAPAVAAPLQKLMDAMLAQTSRLEERLKELASEKDKTDAEIEAEVTNEVQQAIDANPALVHWKTNNPELFKEAVAFDNVLKEQQRWIDKPYAERFAKVVDLVVAEHGEGVLPTKAPQPSAADVRKAAEAKLSAAKPKPVTLSDLPAGSTVEQTENEKLENISLTDLHSKLAGMNPQQIANFLREATL